MSFEVTGEAYGRFMGRYSEPLAAQFVDLLDPAGGQRALDVGCGPGALTEALVRRLGPAAVTAVDPSPTFVEAAGRRLPGVAVCRAAAERLPFQGGSFHLAAAQLVVHFMADPVAGLREMRRVTRPGGTVAACVWDHAGGRGPLGQFWRAAVELDPATVDESALPGVRDGHLAELFQAAGLRDLVPSTLSVGVSYATYEQWWEPFTLGVGPAGAQVARLDPDRRDELSRRCRRLLPPAPFEITAMAWTVRGRR